MKIRWKNIIVQVYDKRDTLDEVIEDLVVPFRVLKSGSKFLVSCRREEFIDVAGLRVPLVFKDYCDTQGCIVTVYIALPRDHPLRPLLRRAVEQTWLETVREVELSPFGTIHVEFTSDAETETVTVECEELGKPVDRETVLQVPLKTLKRNLEKVLRNRERVLEIIRDTVRLVEEVEKQLQLTCEEAELELEENVEYLKRRLRRAYLSIIKPRDELDVEF